METYDVVLLSLTSHETVRVTVDADEGETSYDIALHICVDGDDIVTADEQYFYAYQKMRDALLARGYGLQCKGSLPNAVQSGMMAGTPLIYLVREGQPALEKDRACLWDYCESSDFPTTSQQQTAEKQWMQSLRQITQGDDTV